MFSIPTKLSGLQSVQDREAAVWEVQRLFSERSKLLATGTYTMSDVLIRQLTARIDRLSSASSGHSTQQPA
jgi:hypothetical protein